MNIFCQLSLKSTLTSFLVLSSFLSTCALEAWGGGKTEGQPTISQGETTTSQTQKRKRVEEKPQHTQQTASPKINGLYYQHYGYPHNLTNAFNSIEESISQGEQWALQKKAEK